MSLDQNNEVVTDASAGENDSFRGCLITGGCLLLSFLIFNWGLSYFGEAASPGGFWVALVLPFVAFSAGTSLSGAVLIYQFGFKALKAFFKGPRNFFNTFFDELDDFSVWPFAIAFLVGVLGCAFIAGWILSMTSELSFLSAAGQLSLFSVVVCGLFLVPYNS